VIRALDTTLLSLNCFILGDDRDPDRVLVTKIRTAENVSELKDLIKGKRSVQLSDVDASDLELWSVSFPIADLPSKRPTTIGPKLRSPKLLSDVFSRQLDIHIVELPANII
jgi:hypothetical protein